MTALLSSDGPFADSQDQNRVGDPLPYERPVEGLFDPDRHLPLHTERAATEEETERST